MQHDGVDVEHAVRRGCPLKVWTPMTSRTLRSGLLLVSAWCLAVALFAQSQSVPSVGKAVTGNPGLQATLERLEEQIWETFKNNDKKGFSALETDDYTAVYADGNGDRDLQGAVDSMKNITIISYSLSNFKLTPICSNVVLLRYQAAASYTVGAQAFSGKLAVSDIWVKRGGQWKSFHYHETEMK